MASPQRVLKCIGLATPVEDPIRFARAQAHFAAREVEVDGWVYGLHKSTSGLDSSYPYDVDNPGTGFRMGPHPVNIWLGHYMIWNALRVSDAQPLDAWMVLECDAEFPEGWGARYHRVHEQLATLPPYDLVYVGSCCTGGHAKTQLTEDLYRLDGCAPQCNHAYLVTKAAAEILCTTLRKVWAPIDIQQASECWGTPLPNCVPQIAPPSRSLVVYTVLPRLVGQFDTEIPT